MEHTPEIIFYAASFKGTLSYQDLLKKSNELVEQLFLDGVRSGNVLFAEYPGVGIAEGRTDIWILSEGY